MSTGQQHLEHSEVVTASERANVNNTRIDISERTVSTLALIFASMALVVGIWCLLEARAARNRADVAIMRTEGFTRMMIAEGRDPYPHRKGEDN